MVTNLLNRVLSKGPEKNKISFSQIFFFQRPLPQNAERRVLSEKRAQLLDSHSSFLESSIIAHLKEKLQSVTEERNNAVRNVGLMVMTCKE